MGSSNPLHDAGRSGSNVRHSKEDALSEREFELLLEGAREINNHHYYDPDPEFIISVLGRLGLRRGELVHMKESWINWRDKTIEIPSHEPCDFGMEGEVCGYCKQMAQQRADYAGNDLTYEDAIEWVWVPKTEAAARTIYFGFEPRLEIYIERYFDNPNYDRVEVSGTAIGRRVKKAAKEADEIDPTHISPHSLRATCATYHAGRGLKLLSLMQMMGWVKPETAEIYIGRNSEKTKNQLNSIHK